MNLVRRWWGAVWGSFWFVPSAIVAVSIGIAILLIWADAHGPWPWMDRWPRLFGAGAAGAREMLSTIAGSMMTIVGVAFSMTLVTLALASSQYTSRILRNFIRDRITQVVLGTCAGIVTYCLIVLRTIRGGDTSSFIPSLAVSFSMILAIGGIGVLIIFIHHIAVSIQASTIIASVARETLRSVDRLFPGGAEATPDGEDGENPPIPPMNWQSVSARATGYIQWVDHETLLRLALAHRTVVRMDRGIGEFVVRDTPLASFAEDTVPEDGLVAALQDAYQVSRHRTVEQDPGFGIRQITDIALHALSPGINDTTTAVMCVDYLTAILARLATRTIPSPVRLVEGQIRVIAIGPTFASLLDASLDEVRDSGSGNVYVLARLLDAIHTIAGVVRSPVRRAMLLTHLHWIGEVAERTLQSSRDRALFERSRGRAIAALT